MIKQTFNVIIKKEENTCIVECLEIGTVSQGNSIKDGITNLKEATELYLEEFKFSKYL